MRTFILFPALLALLASADLPETAPAPPDNPRAPEASSSQPETAGEAASGNTDNAIGDLSTEDAPADGAPEADGGDDAEDAAEAPDPASAPDRPPEPVDEAVIARCETELRALGAVFERRDTIDGDGACGVYRPYNLREAAPGGTVKPETEMTCASALATVRWVRNEVLPATRALGMGVELSEITHASTYVCRNRNNRPDAKISEHARGSAIDISGFGFDGHDPIPVVPRVGVGTIEEAFQRAVRAGACMHFTTVLGPGSDENHDDHLHFDLAERSSGYRLCQ